MCRVIQSSSPLRSRHVDGLEISDNRMGNIRPRYNAAPGRASRKIPSRKILSILCTQIWRVAKRQAYEVSYFALKMGRKPNPYLLPDRFPNIWVRLRVGTNRGGLRDYGDAWQSP